MPLHLIMKFAAEFFATFFFVAVIVTTGNPVYIAVALLAAIMLVKDYSGGHLNPAVSIMAAVSKSISAVECVVYVVAQITGALVALLWCRNMRMLSRA